jgi:hypothetical protein
MSHFVYFDPYKIILFNSYYIKNYSQSNRNYRITVSSVNYLKILTVLKRNTSLDNLLLQIILKEKKL